MFFELFFFYILTVDSLTARLSTPTSSCCHGSELQQQSTLPCLQFGCFSNLLLLYPLPSEFQPVQFNTFVESTPICICSLLDILSTAIAKILCQTKKTYTSFPANLDQPARSEGHHVTLTEAEKTGNLLVRSDVLIVQRGKSSLRYQATHLAFHSQ